MDTRAFRFRPRVFERGAFDAASGGAAEALLRLADRARPVLLDSAAGWPCRFSLLAFDPVPPDPGGDLAALRELGARLVRNGGDEVPGPFHGGFAGALAYDLGVPGEGQALPDEPWGQPPIVGGLYTDFLVFDEELRTSWLVLGDEPGDGRPPVAERRAAIEAALARAPARRAPEARGPLVRHTLPDVHRARIEEVRARIARGDFYQANLAHRFTRAVAGSPEELYLALRAANPAPYMGYCRWDGERPGALCSSSPELLLELVREDGRRIARTRPIKGTAARAPDPVLDERRAEELRASEKDRAELAMIVDLERNDLGRTAKPGTVRVEEFPVLRTYERVHHLTADVIAEPREECDAWDVLAALFPGGSVTGAPKLASMDAISELEGEGRGFFCGALGFVDTRGEARFNVLIRTVLWRPGEVSFRVGGGITFSSDASLEDAETLAKASALVAAFEPEGVRA